MDLDEPVARFLATKPDSGSPDQPVAERRALILRGSDLLFDEFGEPAAAVHAREEYELPRPGGSLRLRVYRPSDAEHLPVHVFLHGGAFWLGSIDERVNDAICRERCLGVPSIVVAVDYRLAPEHRYPTQVEDCYAALLWAGEYASRNGGDAANVSIGGVSAGANLSAAVAIAARDRGGPRLRLQLLEVPPLDLTLETMRSSGVGDEYGITVAEMELCTQLYLPRPADARSELASPLLAETLAGLPPARILTAEFDPLRRDGELYAKRLKAAGVPAEHVRYPGAVHGSLALTGSWPGARRWRADVIDSLRRAHCAASNLDAATTVRA